MFTDCIELKILEYYTFRVLEREQILFILFEI